MLEDYGLHELVWNLADEVVSDVLVASPMDAGGRGIALSVREKGAAADLTDAVAYLVWQHRMTGKRGTTEFSEVDASAGTFQVFYPAAMCGAGGVVDASVMLSLGEGRYLSTRNFLIRVERVLVDGLEPEDGFTLFVQAIAAYENVSALSGDAAAAANAAAAAANQAAADLLAAAEAGDFDGKDGADGAAGADGKDGKDGFSPVATVTQTATGGAVITVTDASGTTTADISKGAQGEKGDKGGPGEQGPKGDTGEREPQGIQGETGPAGAKGDKGDDGVSCTHSWNGTVLSVTSASGTSSTDLVGPRGPQGEAGPAGASGTTFTPQSPLTLSGGVLSVDLSGYATKGYVDGAVPTIQASSPLSYSNGVLSVDLSAYATTQYVDSAIAALANLEEQEF